MLRNLLSRFRRDRKGSSTVEFVLIFPGFLAILFVAYESGMMMVRNVLLERGVELAVRELRLGTVPAPRYDNTKDLICEGAMLIDPAECDEIVQVQMEPVDQASWNILDLNSRCIDQTNTTNPLDETVFTEGGSDQLMLIRVCALYQPLFAPTGWGMRMPADGDGNYALIVTAAFVNEPT